MWAGIAAFFQLLVGIGNMLLTRDKHRRKMKKDALKEMSDGIKKRDASSITSAFNRMRRL